MCCRDYFGEKIGIYFAWLGKCLHIVDICTPHTGCWKQYDLYHRILKATAPFAFRFSRQKGLLLLGNFFFQVVKKRLVNCHLKLFQTTQTRNVKLKVLFMYATNYTHNQSSLYSINKKKAAEVDTIMMTKA